MSESRILCAVVGGFLVLLLAAPAIAQQTELARVENFGDGLLFTPVVEFDQLILTVTGPCDFFFRDVIDRKGELAFKLDETTIDGMYRWNLVRVERVGRNIQEILRKARAANDEEVPKRLCRDGRLPAPPLSQTANFTVQRGEIIWDPFVDDEPKPNRDDSGGQSSILGGGGFANTGIDLTTGDRAPAPERALDFVIIDDLIVDGSACIGFDCVNGESFGFDTVRLKENNLRIKFDDTSTAASFPRVDWQLTANDSANGGAGKFSIDDISGSRTPFTVEHNARSHSLYVDDGGRIGSRTSTPSTEIHTIDGDTPTLRLQQDGSSGFAPQTWDVAGNETSFFIRDVTNGSTLPFRVQPGAPSNSIFIDDDGFVGLGTTSPDAAIKVIRSVAQIGLRDSDAADEWFLGVVNANTTTFGISKAGSGQLLVLDAAGNLDIDGEITTSGSCMGGCDRVFSDDYQLESIEEHAAFMWENNHLRGVGPTPDEGRRFNLSQKTTGILNELEKAHIYIDQLHRRLEAKEQAMSEVVDRLERMEALLTSAGLE